MKKHITFLTFLAFSIMLLIGCNTNRQEVSLPEKSEIKSELDMVKAIINKANENYGDRFTRGDEFFYKEKYTENACVMPIGAPEVCGRENIKNYYYGKGENTKFKIKVTAKEVTGGEGIVAEIGNYEVSFVSGKSHDKGKFIAIWQMGDGRWKIHREIWSSDLPKPIEE